MRNEELNKGGGTFLPATPGGGSPITQKTGGWKTPSPLIPDSATFHHSITPILQYSIIPILQYSIIPILHYSIIPLLLILLLQAPSQEKGVKREMLKSDWWREVEEDINILRLTLFSPSSALPSLTTMI